MKFTLSLSTLALISLAAAIPLNGESQKDHKSARDVLPQVQGVGTKHERRMLSAGLKAQQGKEPVYADHTLDDADVSAIKKSGEEVVKIVGKHPGALVLALGNSPTYDHYFSFSNLLNNSSPRYTVATIPQSKRSSLKIYEATMSGAIPSPGSHGLVAAYASNVLKPIIDKAGDFKGVILLDIFTSGASKAEYKKFLAACEEHLDLKGGALSGDISQIAIIDKSQDKPSKQV